MSESDFSVPSASESARGPLAVEALQRQVQSLRSLLTGALMAVFLLSVALNLFLYRQTDLIRKELVVARTMVSEFETSKEQLIKTFIARLQEYAATHPDFNPVLLKYNLRPPGTPAQPGQPPSLAPAPAPSKSP